MEIVGEDAKSQALQVMKNLAEVLRAAGSDFSKVIKYILDSMDDFGVVNDVYGRFSPKTHLLGKPWRFRLCLRMCWLR